MDMDPRATQGRTVTELFIGEVHSAGVELCGIADAQDALAFLERSRHLVVCLFVISTNRGHYFACRKS